MLFTYACGLVVKSNSNTGEHEAYLDILQNELDCYRAVYVVEYRFELLTLQIHGNISQSLPRFHNPRIKIC